MRVPSRRLCFLRLIFSMTLMPACSYATSLPLQGVVHHVSPSSDIQGTINAAPSGDTIFFDAGTYHIDKTIILKSGQLYHGAAGAILQGASPIFEVKPNDSHDIGVDGLTFEGGTSYFHLYGSDAAAGRADRIRIVNNIFRNMRPNASPETVDQPALDMKFVKNSWIDHNVFTDLRGGHGIISYNPDNTGFTFNIFNNLRQALSMTFEGIERTGRDIYVSYNVCTGIDRMCLEIQDSEGYIKAGLGWTQRLLVEGNWADGWTSTKVDTKMAYSIVVDSGSGTVVRNNYAKFDGVGRGDYGNELGGIGAQSYGNYLDGWTTGIILYEPNQIVRNNNLINCGSTSSHKCVEIYTKLSFDDIVFGNLADASLPVPPRPVNFGGATVAASR